MIASGRPSLLGFLVLPGVLLSAAPARAAEGEVTADTTAQFYDVRGPSGQTTLLRRRLTSTLGVTAYDLLPRPKEAGQELLPDLSFRARLRYDADYGASSDEANSASTELFIPGFSRGPVDLMYAYVEGRRLFHGVVGFKLGRQHQIDPLGYWSFDGASVRLTTPAFVAVEAYGGMEVRGGLPLSGPIGRYERDGVWRGDRDGFAPTAYSSFQQAAVAPAFGAAIETAGVTWLHGRLAYRRVMSTGASDVASFAGPGTTAVYDGTRVSQERLGYAVTADWDKVGAVNAGLVYDLYSVAFSSIYASAEVRPTSKLVVGVDYDYFRPTFDADSIFNFFAVYPMNDVGARVRWEPTTKLSFTAQGHVRAFENDTSANLEQPSPYVAAPIGTVLPAPAGTSFAGGGSLGARYQRLDGAVAFRGMGDFGEAGDRVGGDVLGERLLGSRYVVRGRLGFWHWEDKLRSDRSALSFGSMVGVGYRFFHGSQAGVELDSDVNRLVGIRFRWLAYLSLAVGK